MEQYDRRISGQQLTGSEREKLQNLVTNLRDGKGMSWARIAQKIGAMSPSTPRRIYREAGKNSHGLLPGKGGRRISWKRGDWCDARCIGANEESPCECSCGGYNHAGGVSRASAILKKAGANDIAFAEKMKLVEEAILRNEAE